MKIRGEKSKKAQMKISFGMIFSIILIIAFIAFAFYAIIIFIGIGNEADVGVFVNSLQEDVNRLWKSSHASQVFTYELPSEVKKVCFVKHEYKNVAFIPRESSSFVDVNITHFNLTKTLDIPNSEKERNIEYDPEPPISEGLCFENDGKINIFLKKDYGDAQVYARK
jgi:hypothetical protein